MKFVFPTLYLHTDKNQIRFWNIWVIGTDKGFNAKASIYTKYGIKGGKIIQPYPKIIDKPLGKKGPYTRAIQLAKTKWENRIKKGYVSKEPKIKEYMAPNIRITNNSKIVVPMRPYNLSNHIVIYPAYVQPKIDGYRALLHKQNNMYEFLSNTGRKYSHLNHLKNDLNKIAELKNKSIYLDGELYIEKEHINVLRSILSTIELSEEQKEMAKNIKYFVFDYFDLNKMDLDYEQRYKILQNIFKTKFKNIMLIPTTIIRNEKQLDSTFNNYVKQGYEGIIIRNMRGTYKLRGKSMNVLKSKDVKKDMFTIVGYKEAKGNNKGTVIWEIRCNKDPRRSFWAKPMGSREERKKYFKNAEKYIGKKVTVKYFEINKNGCITKNPVAFF